MFIAQKLRKENIAEYLLYMWQIEELLRSYSLDMDKVEKTIILPYQLEQDKQKTLYEWYESLIEMIKKEDVTQKGHLQINKNTLSQIEEFHIEIYNNPEQTQYKQFYHKIQPIVNNIRKKLPNQQVSDIEICFTFLFGIMLLKMQKKEISQDTLAGQKSISEFLKFLSYNFKQYEEGKLDLS